MACKGGKGGKKGKGGRKGKQKGVKIIGGNS